MAVWNVYTKITRHPKQSFEFSVVQPPSEYHISAYSFRESDKFQKRELKNITNQQQEN